MKRNRTTARPGVSKLEREIAYKTRVTDNMTVISNEINVIQSLIADSPLRAEIMGSLANIAASTTTLGLMAFGKSHGRKGRHYKRKTTQ